MFLGFTFLVLSAFFSPVHSQATFDDMSDEDFASIMKVTGDFGEKHARSAGEGCITGAIGAAPAGLQFLCIGCATGAAGNVVKDIVFPPKDSK